MKRELAAATVGALIGAALLRALQPAASECTEGNGASTRHSDLPNSATAANRPIPIAADPAEIVVAPPPVVISSFGEDAGPAIGDVPVPWPESVREDLTPAAIKRDLRRILAACGSGPLVSVDCSEPPCMLAFFDPNDEGVDPDVPYLSACPEWSERYGRGGSNAEETVLCADNTAHRVALIGPYLPELRSFSPLKWIPMIP